MLPNIVLFEGTDATNTVSLWETDGTVSGTFELSDVASPPPLITGEALFGFAPSPAVSLDLTVFNNQVLFSGRVGPNDIGPFTLWTSDGTAAGTVPLTIAGANSNGLFSPTAKPAVTPGFTVFGAKVLFRGIDTGGASGLWMTNGTALGTTEITGVNGAASTGVSPTDITVLNDAAALFNGADTAGHLGLWTTDGTGAGTQELTSIGGAAASGLNPTDMTVFNGEVLFNGVDANGLSGLWMTNGSGAGTHELTGIAGAATTGSGLDPTDITVFGSEVLFSGVDANGLTGLWVTNGTAGGTHEVFAEAAGATAAKDPHGLSPTDLTIFNGEVFFSGFDKFGRKQLWETDGTAAGTQMLTVAPASTSFGLSPSNFEVYNGQLLFQGDGQQRVSGLWTTDGTAAGTQEITPSSGIYSFGFAAEDLTALTPGALVLPTIAGTVSGQTTTSEAPVRPFAHVTIGDANVGATDTLTITLGGKGGTLTDGTGFSSLTTVSAGVYRLSGTAAAITSELEALLFTPTAGAPNTTSTTTFTLSDQSSASGAPVVNNTTSVIDSDPGVAPTVTSSIFWQNTSGQASIWEMDGSTLVGGGPVTPNPGPSFRAVGTGDFNKDGHSDVLWQNPSTGQASIWEMSGNSLLGGGPVSPNPGLNFDAVGTGDFNGDGFSDILWQNTSTGQASIWEMNGNTLMGGGPVTPNPGPSFRAVGTGDFNKDGDSDILWQNTSTGQISIWEMHGNTLVGGGPVTPNPGPAWQAIGTGDFNGDGFSDILLQNTNTGAVSVWEMNGNTLIGGGQVANPGTSWHAVGTGAGGSDILLQNTSGQATIWEMSGNTITGGGPVSPNPGSSWHAIGLT
jgi:ELWxxDGT repeat protein